MLFKNISKTTQYFYLNISGPHRRVLKTFSGSFQIGKIEIFSTQKSPYNFLNKFTKDFPYKNFMQGFPLRIVQNDFF